MTANGRTATPPSTRSPARPARPTGHADPAEYSGTWRACPIRGRINGLPYRGSFMALGEGARKLAAPADIRAQIGDAVTARPDERIPPTPPRSTP